MLGGALLLEACRRLADAGCVLGNQMVLLKGVNDSPRLVKELNHKLLLMRVRPYYIYQCDLARGISHFRTPIETGRRIIRSLVMLRDKKLENPWRKHGNIPL